MGERERDARWYYYSAIAHSGLGNNVAALEHAKRAAAMEPDNATYRNLVQQLESGGSWYEQRQAAYGYPSYGSSNLCLKLCIANMICNMCCLGGGCCGGRGPYF
jgi:molecular chaperone DnaJ